MLDVTMPEASWSASILGQVYHRRTPPAPGALFPDRIRLTGTSHQLVTFGELAALDRFRGRWKGLVSVQDGTGAGLDAARAGVCDGGAVLVRPDGFIGFRAVPADTAGINALDVHLASYLVPVRC
jgi:6-methylpretetramide 4-monooxygenase / 4-hydroxy-6-methylpretetramide 12a-monooxygenase